MAENSLNVARDINSQILETEQITNRIIPTKSTQKSTLKLLETIDK